jgi:hypothetical protein
MTFKTETGVAVDNVVVEGASVLIKSPTINNSKFTPHLMEALRLR